MITSCLSLSTGSALVFPRIMQRGAGLRRIWIPVRIGVIRHKTEGVVLFDTGLAERILDCLSTPTRSAVETVIPLTPERSAVSLLAEKGISREDVRHIIVSHTHVDHVGGLRDFPKATVHMAHRAWRHMRDSSTTALTLAGVLPELFPDDIEERANWIRSYSPKGYGPFHNTLDLFGDGSIRLIDMPGHAPGHLGALVALRHGGHAFFAGDAAYFATSYRENRGPSRVYDRWMRIDKPAYRATLGAMNQIWRTQPHVRIVLAHCPEGKDGEVRSASEGHRRSA